jgi:hypothetical protein
MSNGAAETERLIGIENPFEFFKLIQKTVD